MELHDWAREADGNVWYDVGSGLWVRYDTVTINGARALRRRGPGDDYYIDAVPHTMYVDGEIALHGAFWYDAFGWPKIHGCVNMSPRVAERVFNWSQDAPNDLWVWVHDADHGDGLQ